VVELIPRMARIEIFMFMKVFLQDRCFPGFDVRCWGVSYGMARYMWLSDVDSMASKWSVLLREEISKAATQRQLIHVFRYQHLGSL
jgi:hypothetical protein